jgi:hypothetical protein
MDWQDVLKTVAPTVAAALLGPMGGIAVAAIGSAIGIDAPTQDKIAKAFTAGQLTPDALEKIKLLELDYQNQERERGFKYAELAFKDVDSARAMQIATHSKMPAVLTVLVTVGFFGILSLLFFHPELKGNEIVMVMVGQLSAVWAGCVAFYTGTTYGSANKNAMLAAK